MSDITLQNTWQRFNCVRDVAHFCPYTPPSAAFLKTGESTYNFAEKKPSYYKTKAFPLFPLFKHQEHLLSKKMEVCVCVWGGVDLALQMGKE